MKRTSVKGNFILNVILSVSGFIFPLITFPYIQRILLPTGTGKVAFATSIISYFSMFAQLGVSTYGIRACAKVRDNREELTKTVHELLGINLFMDAVAYILLAVSLVLIPRLAQEKLLFIVISSTILLTSIGMEWLYNALEKYKYITIRSIVFKTVALIATFLLVKSESDYILYGGVSIFASSASNLLNFINAGKYVDLKRPKACDWKRHLKPVLIFFALSCAATIYTNLDAVMLGFMTTDADIGFYNAAVKVKTLLVSVVTSLGAVLLPRSSYYVEYGQVNEFRRMSQKALHFVLLTASAFMVYFMLYAEECILVLSGEEYVNSILPMRIVMPTVLFIGMTNILGIQILVPLGREKVVLKSELAGAAADLILNILLIPVLHSTGSAIATLVAEAVVLGVQYYELREDVKEFLSRFHWARVIAALFVAVAVCLPFKLMGIKPLFAVFLSALCFFSAYGLFLLWRKEELVTESWRMILLIKEGQKNRLHHKRDKTHEGE